VNQIDKIVKWQIHRQLDQMPYVHTNEVKNILEECLESSGSIDSRVARTVADTIVKNHITKFTNAEAAVDAYCDIIVFAVGSILKLGFDPVLALGECIKEIHERKGNYSPAQGKWIKVISESPTYKANYSAAKKES